MAKVHYEAGSKVFGDLSVAMYCWKREGIVPFVAKACTGLMVKSRKFLTKDKGDVTCQHCLRIINNG